MKKLMISAALVAVISVALLAGCGNSDAREEAAPGQSLQTGQQATDNTFTAQELSRYDGKEGRRAYVAVDGVVYDVTGSAMWPQGSHTSCPESMAGQDLSEVIKTAPPRMRESLMRFPVAGTLQ